MIGAITGHGSYTLHYTTLHYTTLHYTTLHYTTLQNTTLHYTTLLVVEDRPNKGLKLTVTDITRWNSLC